MSSASAINAVDSITVDLLRIEFEPKLLLHHAREEAADRVLLPSGRLHHGFHGRASGRTKHLDYASLLRKAPALIVR